MRGCVPYPKVQCPCYTLLQCDIYRERMSEGGVAEGVIELLCQHGFKPEALSLRETREAGWSGLGMPIPGKPRLTLILGLISY